jgi:hypothetical protein
MRRRILVLMLDSPARTKDDDEDEYGTGSRFTSLG